MDLHTCSYHCERPECIRVQRDELRDRLERLEAQRRSADYVLVPKEPTSDEPKPCWCDVQGIGEPNVSCGDCPNRDYKVPKARIEAPLGVPIDPWTPEELEALDKVLAEDTPDPQLRKFYGVHTYPELVTAMEHHIERLQAKLPKTDSTIRFVREG